MNPIVGTTQSFAHGIRTLALIGASALLAASAAAQSPSASGHWEGTIRIPNRPVPVAIDLARDASGGWIGSMSSPGSTSVNVPLNELAVDSTGVHFVASLPGPANFHAKLSARGDSLVGTAGNESGVVELVLARTGEAHVMLPPASSKLTKEFEGAWEGSLTVPAATLRIGLKLTPGAGGVATGALTSIDQGGLQVPATTVAIDGMKIRVELRAVSATYSGTLHATGELEGSWSQGGQAVPLNFKRKP